MCLCVAEWSQLKVSGRVCGSLELHEEDRREIDEFKKELQRNGFPVKLPVGVYTQPAAASWSTHSRKQCVCG